MPYTVEEDLDTDMYKEDAEYQNVGDSSIEYRSRPEHESWFWNTIGHQAIVYCFEIWGTLSPQKLMDGIGLNESARGTIGGVISQLANTQFSITKEPDGRWKYIKHPDETPTYKRIKPLSPEAIQHCRRTATELANRKRSK